MLQTGIVTRHAYNAKTRLQTQAEYCNKVGYQHKLHSARWKTKKGSCTVTRQGTNNKLNTVARHWVPRLAASLKYHDRLHYVNRHGTKT